MNRAAWARWQRRSTVLPLGYLLRHESPERWVRFYSLPEGKRYADEQAEWEELKRRHASVSSIVIGAGQPCDAFLCNYGDLDADGISWSLNSPPKDWSIDADTAEKLAEATFYTASFAWNPVAFERRLVLTAQDASGPLAVLSRKTGGIYCPYDGGMDVFLASAELRDRLRERFASWASPLDSGY